MVFGDDAGFTCQHIVQFLFGQPVLYIYEANNASTAHYTSQHVHKLQDLPGAVESNGDSDRDCDMDWCWSGSEGCDRWWCWAWGWGWDWDWGGGDGGGRGGGGGWGWAFSLKSLSENCTHACSLGRDHCTITVHEVNCSVELADSP